MFWLIAIIGGLGIGIAAGYYNINPIFIGIFAFVYGILVGYINDKRKGN